MRNDPDRGDAYTSRVITVAALFLVAVTVLLVVAAPLLDRPRRPDVRRPDRCQRLGRSPSPGCCLPQVFFYGMYVLVGQILNARGRFGPMMWAPIANNVISVVVLLVYIVVYGQAEGAEVHGGFTSGQELLLGLGSTLGIVVQLLILVPYLRRVGLRLPAAASTCAAPGSGTRCGWASGRCCSSSSTRSPHVVVQRLARAAAAESPADGTGYTVYSVASWS